MRPETHRFFMGLALDLAAEAAGRTSPNPLVGCVVAREGEILGRGFHAFAGADHAEVVALREAGETARGADLYVTLEPCSHHGRTPPCTEAIIRAGISRVVAAMEDPNPTVAGSGFAALTAAGIEVLAGVERERAARLNEAFALSIVQKRSFVHLKLAATLDGRIATASGDSFWISSEVSREATHRLRDRCGAVVVGVETALTDNPRLTVRVPGREERRILRVVLDRSLRINPGLWMLEPREAVHTLVVCGDMARKGPIRQLERLGARVLPVPVDGEGRLDLPTVLTRLYEMGIMEILVEGGAHTARTFLDAGCVDRCHIYYSPRILGGLDSISMIGGKSPKRIDEAVVLDQIEVSRSGPDIYVTGVPVRK
jgi:diaminohydroxyphosphoribosylaminopyrimidine deaminase/5-amino-6-(5-phosphoribosylamino)uracil reductase